MLFVVVPTLISWSKEVNFLSWSKTIFFTEFFILRKSVLRCCKVEFTLFLSVFSFTNIHVSQDSRGRGGYLFMLCLILFVSVVIWYVFLTAKSLFTRGLRIVLVFANFTIAPLISEFELGNTLVTMAILKRCLGTFSKSVWAPFQKI